MQKLPKVVVTSVIRAVQMGDSHGGVYLVDLESENFEKVVDWHKENIDWQGRGGERGLRGIAFRDDLIYCAASDEILVLNQRFETIDVLHCEYLSQCHEIFIWGNLLYITSTRYDHLIVYDFENEMWDRGYHIRAESWIRGMWHRMSGDEKESLPVVTAFDASSQGGPKFWRRKERYHINMAFVDNDDLCFSGVMFENILRLKDGYIDVFATVPSGTHNAQPYKDKLIYNHTPENCACLADRTGEVIRRFPIPMYEEGQLDTGMPDSIARQAFARGLCYVEDQFLILGSSPATITVYDIESGEMLKTLNLSKDVRNAIHGLELWPY